MKTATRIARNLMLIGGLLVAVACSNETSSSNSENTVEKPSVSIQEATFFGNVDAINAHVAAKSDLNEKDEYGSAPLHIASTFGKTEAAILLIESGADLGTLSGDGSTPLHVAAFYGRTEIVDALLKNGANTDVRNSYNATALESVQAPFEQVKPVYDQLSKDLGPFGLKLDYDELIKNRRVIAEMIVNAQ